MTARVDDTANAREARNRSISQPDENRPVYQMHPTYGITPLTKEALYKTLIYANAYAAYVWREKPVKELDMFNPPSPYGIRIVVTQIPPRGGILTGYVPWLLHEIGDRLRRDNHYASFTAILTNHEDPFAVLSVTKSRLTPIARSLPSAATRRTVDEHDILRRLGSISRTASSSSDHVQARDVGRHVKRGRSANSFDRSLTTAVSIRPGFVVKDAENILMLTLLSLAKSAFEQKSAEMYVARSPCHDIEVEATPGISQASLQGKEILDSLIDAVEWQYAQHARTGIFFMMHMIVRNRNAEQTEQDRDKSVAVIDIFTPDV